MSEVLYYSTNRDVRAAGFTGFRGNVTFREALFMGLAPDKGLFMPTRIPRLSGSDIFSLKGKPYQEVAYEVLKRFLPDEMADDELRSLTREAYDFEVPIEKIEGLTRLLKLDKGPTASFKDFAARAMARLMQRMKPQGKDITILVATSGDTGSAVGEAYHGMRGFSVYILYPRDEVSPMQEKQLDSIGDNVRALAIDGKFDDCQRLVKEAFADPELKKLNLTSANSVNIGRILPQIAYYFYSYANTPHDTRKVTFSIPSGNFGNSLGCELARRMGLPVKRIIIAVNDNDEFPRFLDTGVYEKLEPSRRCLSNAMNVGNPSNLARFFDLYGGTLDKEGTVHKKPDILEMKRNIYSVSISDRETVDTIRSMHERYDVIVDPHTAVGIAALIRTQRGGTGPSICVQTADPAKFPEIIRNELGMEPEVPDSLKRMEGRKGECDSLANDYNGFKSYLLNRHKGAGGVQ